MDTENLFSQLHLGIYIYVKYLFIAVNVAVIVAHQVREVARPRQSTNQDPGSLPIGNTQLYTRMQH